MSKESIQKKLGRVRPPRVHITYDVETGVPLLSVTSRLSREY